MKIAIILGVAFLASGVAQAADPVVPDANMTCADYIKAEKAAGTWGVSTGDKEADTLDKKVADYCTANPKAPAMEAIQKAMGG